MMYFLLVALLSLLVYAINTFNFFEIALVGICMVLTYKVIRLHAKFQAIQHKIKAKLPLNTLFLEPPAPPVVVFFKNNLKYLFLCFYFVSSVVFLIDYFYSAYHGATLNYAYLIGFFIALLGFVFLNLPEKNAGSVSQLETVLAQVLLLWSCLWWYGDAMFYLLHHVSFDFVLAGLLVFGVISSASFYGITLLFKKIVLPVRTLLPLMLLFACFNAFAGLNQAFILPLWIASFTVLYTILFRTEKAELPLSEEMQVVSFLLLTYVCTHTLVTIALTFNFSFTLQLMIWGMVPALALLLLSSQDLLEMLPIKHSSLIYQHETAEPIVIFLVLWLMAFAGVPVDTTAAFYAPDFAMLFVFFSIVFWGNQNRKWIMSELNLPNIIYLNVIFYIGLFFITNVIMLHALTYWLNLPYSRDMLLQSQTVRVVMGSLWLATFLLTSVKLHDYFKRQQY